MLRGRGDRTSPALEEPHSEAAYVLRLYVAGGSPRSRKAIETLRRVCEEYLQGRVDLKVIDIFQQEELARRDGVIVAPTLVRVEPLPERRFVGEFGDASRLVAMLEITAPEDLPPREKT